MKTTGVNHSGDIRRWTTRHLTRLSLVLLLAFLVCATWTTVVHAQSGGPFDLSWYTIDGGGGTSSGGDFSLSGTVGQHDAGAMTGGDFDLRGGFWHCSAPATVSDVSISDAGGGSAQFAWSGSGAFDIWQSGDPYFHAGDGGSALAGDNVTSPYSVPSVIGDPASNHYFLVLAQNKCGVSGPSNRTGAFDFSLEPGD